MSAGTSVASLAMGSSSDTLSTMEIEVVNTLPTPLVLSKFETTNCSSSKTMITLRPGESDTAVILSPDDDGWDNSYVTMRFFSGGGLDEDQNEIAAIASDVKFQYTGGNWVPMISIDGNSGYTLSNKEYAIAACFEADADKNVLDFTIASMGSEKGISQCRLEFMPSSRDLTTS